MTTEDKLGGSPTMWHMHTHTLHCSCSHSAWAPENFLVALALAHWEGSARTLASLVVKWQLLWPLGNGGVSQLSPCKKPLPSISALPSGLPRKCSLHNFFPLILVPKLVLSQTNTEVPDNRAMGGWSMTSPKAAWQLDSFHEKTASSSSRLLSQNTAQ